VSKGYPSGAKQAEGMDNKQCLTLERLTELLE